MSRAVVNPAVEYVGWILDNDRTLPRGARAVLGELARHWNRKTLTAWPSATRIGKTLGYSERHVRRIFELLAASPYVTAEHRPGRPSAWRFTFVERHPSMGPTPDMVSGVKLSFTPDMVSATPDMVSDEPVLQPVREPARRAPEPPPFTRCPNRTGWKICESDCPECGGTGHVAADEVAA